MPVTRSVMELCVDPYAMRRRADRGLVTPCYRCWFEEPGVGRGCKAVNRGMQLKKPVDPKVPRVSPKRGGPEQLMMVLPTADVVGEPGPTFDPPEKEKPQ